MELMNIVNNIKGCLTTVKDVCVPNNRALTVEETVVKIHNFPPEKVAVEPEYLSCSDREELMAALNEISLVRLFEILDKDEVSIGIEFADYFKKILYLSKTPVEVSILKSEHYLCSELQEKEYGALLVMSELRNLKEHIKQNPDIRYIKVCCIGNDITNDWKNHVDTDFSLNFSYQQLNFDKNTSSIRCMIGFIPCHNDGACIYSGTTKRRIDYSGMRGSFDTEYQIYQHRDFSYFAISENIVSRDIINNGAGRIDYYLRPNESIIAFEGPDEMGCLPDNMTFPRTMLDSIEASSYRVVRDPFSDIVANTVMLSSQVIETNMVPEVEWPLKQKLIQWTLDFRLIDWVEAARRNDVMSGIILGNYLDDMMKFSTYLGFSVYIDNALVMYKGSSSEIDGKVQKLREYLNLLAEKALTYKESNIGYLKFNHVGTGLGGDVDTDFDVDMFFYCNDRHPAKRTCSMQLQYIPCKNNAKPVKTGKCLLSSIRAPLTKTESDPVVTAAIYEHVKGYEFIIYHYINEYEEPTTYIRRAPSLGSDNTKFDHIDFID